MTTDSDGNTFTADGINLGDADYTALAALSTTTTANAASAQTAVGNAINQVATDRATVGGNLARLQHTGSALLAYQDNLSAASSQIKDIDVAYESAHYARLSLKVQTASAILAQSNVLSQSALRLLGITKVLPLSRRHQSSKPITELSDMARTRSCGILNPHWQFGMIIFEPHRSFGPLRRN